MNEKITFRNHFTYVLKNLTGIIVVVIIIFLQDPREFANLVMDLMKTPGASLPLTIGGIVVLLVLGFFILIQIRRWKRTHIIIDGTNLIVHQATMIRKDYVIAMQNISSINQVQNLMQKLFGVYTITVDTNTTATADEADVSIILDRKKSEEFRKLIEERMAAAGASSGANTSSATSQSATNSRTAKVSEEPYRKYADQSIEDEDFWDVMYSPKETIIHAIFSTGMLGLVFAIGAIILAVVTMDDIEFSSNGLMDILISVIIILVALWALIGGAIKKYLMYCNFRAKRDGNYILLTYGLTTTRRFRVPIDKINNIYVKQSDLGRIFKMQEVHISAIGMGDDDSELKNVLLYGKQKDIRERLAILLPEFISLYDGSLEHKESKARFADIAWALFKTLIACVLVLVFVPLSLLIRIMSCIGALALLLVIVLLRNRTVGIYVGENGIKVRTGVFGLTDTLVGYDRIQTVEYEAGPILRKLGHAKGTITLFGGMLDMVVATDAFRKEYFERIAERTVETDCFK